MALTLQVILHAHPYHIDSLLQMSEVSRLGDDIQMAAELIGRGSKCISTHYTFHYVVA